MLTLKFVRGTTTLEVYAAPVHFWQSVQWQRAVVAGSPVGLCQYRAGSRETDTIARQYACREIKLTRVLVANLAAHAGSFSHGCDSLVVIFGKVYTLIRSSDGDPDGQAMNLEGQSCLYMSYYPSSHPDTFGRRPRSRTKGRLISCSGGCLVAEHAMICVGQLWDEFWGKDRRMPRLLCQG